MDGLTFSSVGALTSKHLASAQSLRTCVSFAINSSRLTNDGGSALETAAGVSLVVTEALADMNESRSINYPQPTHDYLINSQPVVNNIVNLAQCVNQTMERR
jgi:hypothetical protein